MSVDADITIYEVQQKLGSLCLPILEGFFHLGKSWRKTIRFFRLKIDKKKRKEERVEKRVKIFGTIKIMEWYKAEKTGIVPA